MGGFHDCMCGGKIETCECDAQTQVDNIEKEVMDETLNELKSEDNTPG